MKIYKLVILAVVIPFLSESCATRVRNSRGVTILETYGNWASLNYSYTNGKEKSTLVGTTVNHSQPTTSAFNGATKLVGGIGVAAAGAITH